MIRKLTGFLFGLVLLSSCGEYQKIMKGNDAEVMFTKAREYYSNGNYNKARDLFEAVRQRYIGTSRGQVIAYYRALCSYNQKNYQEAAEYFQQFVKQYPENEFAEEASYMIGYCNYLSSPNVRLDQTVTQEAIRSFTLFLTRFPNSHHKDEINDHIDIMRDKLSYKDYLNAENYYKRGHYIAAIISMENCLKDYPGTKYREEIMYMMFNSRYELAVNSIQQKQYERFTDAQEEYYYFVDEYPNSRHAQEISKKYEVINRFIESYNLEEDE